MKPEPGWGLELLRWYDRGHLPALAAARGCIRAQRFWNNDDELERSRAALFHEARAHHVCAGGLRRAV